MRQTTLLTRLVRSPLLGHAGERLGQVRDVVARLVEGSYPLVSGFVVRIGGRDVFISVRDTAAIEPGCIQLEGDRVDLRSFERRPGEILLAGDILGHHVISVTDAQLVWVKDIELGRRDGALHVMGIEGGSGAIVDRLRARFGGDSRPHLFLDWSSIEPLLAHVPTARRRLPFRRLARLHPAELADLVESGSPIEGEEILRAVGEDRDLEADVFEELDDEYQLEFLQTRPEAEAAEILSNMSPDDAADLLLQMEEETRDRLLGRLPLAQLRKVRMLMGYHPDTAGGLMSPDFLALPADLTVGEALEAARSSDLTPDAAAAVYIVDRVGALIGAAPLIELLRHEASHPLGSIETRDPVVVEPHADVPEIALKMADFNLEALPVVDAEGRMIGVVTVDDLLEVMLPEEWRAVVRSPSGGSHKRRDSPPSAQE
jgi:CBS domain-containing protein